MTLKDLHDHLSKLIADGVNPDTPVARWSNGWDLVKASDLPPWVGKAVVCNETSWGEPGEVWYFEDELHGDIKGDERTVLYL